MTDAKPVKALFAGAPDRRLDTLFQRIATAHASNGPFDVCFVAGRVLSRDVAPETPANSPVPVYVVGDNPRPSSEERPEWDPSQSPQVHYLGRAGVRIVQGLVVAYLAGTYDPVAYGKPAGECSSEYCTSEDVELLKAALRAVSGDVDVFLTWDWPAGVSDGAAGGGTDPPASGPLPAGSAILADLAAQARPRYHVAAHPPPAPLSYARAPYANPDLGAGPVATRFVGLASVGAIRSEVPLPPGVGFKWLHALSLTPAGVMAPEALAALPAGCTACPFRPPRPKRAAEEEPSGAFERRWLGPGGGPGAGRAPDAEPSEGRADVLRDARRTVFVRGIHPGAAAEEVLALAARAGEVEDFVRRRGPGGRLHSYAHVQYARVDAAERACALLQGALLWGRPLEAEPARRRDQGDGASAKPAVGGCWFCLSEEAADLELVAAVGEHWYLAMDKGPLSASHALLVAVDHARCFLALSREARAEGARFVRALEVLFRGRGQALVGFERHVALRQAGGNHCHLALVGVPRERADQAAQAFRSAGQQLGWEFRTLDAGLTDEDAPGGGEEDRGKEERDGEDGGRNHAAAAARYADALADVAGDGEYFVALLPGGACLARAIPRQERHQLQFGRQVLADLVGAPERADWKACLEGKDEAWVRSLKAEFEPLDFTEK